jgi:DNA-binding response OmpR family regulator
VELSTQGTASNLRLEKRGASLWWGELPQRPRVLIIDDDRALSNLVSFVMRHEGFSVDTVNDGDAGIQLAIENTYDAVVLDLRMPGKDGRTVYREIREAGVRTPVLILSAYNARQATEEIGANAYLNKPFEPTELAQAVRRLLTPNARMRLKRSY